MLIKQTDDHSEELAQLERLAKSGADELAKRAAKDLAIRKAGIKGELESAYQIDFHYAASPNWAVIHDLRLAHNGRVAQVDHLLINRWMECYVLESKHFNAGIKITEEGEFMRWNDYKRTYEGMPSPLLQNERHVAVLRDAMNMLDLPTRLGMRINFAFQTFVLISASARIDRPKMFDTGRVIKADQIKERIWRDIDKANPLITIAKTAKIVAGETVRQVAQQLADLHQPIKWSLPIAPALAVSTLAGSVASAPSAELRQAGATAGFKAVKALDPVAATLSSATGPRCKNCQSEGGSILHGKYGYYFQCGKCEANTAIKFSCVPEHKPRLRKAGKEFYRDCAECSSEAHYFTNA